MKFFGISTAVFLATQCVSGHYIFKTLLTESKNTTAAVREPVDNMPFHNITSSDATCNHNPYNATQTVSVAAGSEIGFQLDEAMYHQGPVSIYLGKASGLAADWNGSGSNWFKIAEWGAATYDPITFTSHNMIYFETTIPSSVPSGDYLARIEQLAMHLGTGVVEIFVSCAQITVTGGGSGDPSKVAIPGYISATDPSLTIDIYDSKATSYTVPGPAVYRG